MMPDAPRRTPAGDAAVARHAPELDTGARVLLAAVDGKRTQATLKARFGALVAVEATIERLARDGFIELPVAPAQPGSAATSPVSAPTTAAVSPAPPVPTFDLAVARRMAVRALSETMGPGGDMLALQIERSKTHADFVALHARALGVVRAQRGDEAAATFLQWSPAPPPA
jgi:hypothetical protein